MTLLALDSINYLTSLNGLVPNTRVGLGFDGQRLGLICYSIVKDPNAPPRPVRSLSDPVEYINGLRVAEPIRRYREPCKALVWYADSFENVGISGVYRIVDQILELSTGTFSNTTSIYCRGLRSRTWSFAKESRRTYGVRLIEFEKRAYGSWSEEELTMCVLDDLSEGRIEPAPEFRRRPEFEILNSVLRNIRLGETFDPLAEAALYGLGSWSTLEQRPKWYS